MKGVCGRMKTAKLCTYVVYCLHLCIFSCEVCLGACGVHLLRPHLDIFRKSFAEKLSGFQFSLIFKAFARSLLHGKITGVGKP